MANNNDPSLEELIADSIKRKRSAGQSSKVKVVRTSRSSSGDTKNFKLNIDYSKSDPEFYGDVPRTDELRGRNGRRIVPPPQGNFTAPEMDPDFIRDLRENFGGNVPRDTSSERSTGRRSSGAGEQAQYSGSVSKPAPSPVKATVRRVSHTENIRPAQSAGNNYSSKADNKVKQKKMDDLKMSRYYEDEDVPVKKKKRLLPKIFLGIILLAFIAVVVVWIFISKYAGLFNYVPTGDRLDIENVVSDKKVTNILLIGSDVRNGSGYGLSDSMILISINKDSKEIVMSSFMRDMNVNIPGQDAETWHKLNWAHSHGGPELLMDTLEYNFGIEIDYYAKVDFLAFASIIDSVGGLDITVTAAEANAMIKPMAEQNKIFGNPKATDYIYEAGTYHMNGNQALAFSRIRKGVGDDFARTDRQRQVLGLISEKARSLSVSQLDDLAEKLLPQITTNMEKKKLMKLMASAPALLKYEQISQRVPYGEVGESWNYGSSATDGSIIVPDFELNKQRLKESIYKMSS